MATVEKDVLLNNKKNGNTEIFYPITKGSNVLCDDEETVEEKFSNILISTNASLGQGYGTCATAEATTTKSVLLSGYELAVGGIIAVNFTNAVPAGSSLSVNSKTAKPIYYRGVAITANVIKAGDIATFIYDGTNYHLISLDDGLKILEEEEIEI